MLIDNRGITIIRYYLNRTQHDPGENSMVAMSTVWKHYRFLYDPYVTVKKNCETLTSSEAKSNIYFFCHNFLWCFFFDILEKYIVMANYWKQSIFINYFRIRRPLLICQWRKIHVRTFWRNFFSEIVACWKKYRIRLIIICFNPI